VKRRLHLESFKGGEGKQKTWELFLKATKKFFEKPQKLFIIFFLTLVTKEATYTHLELDDEPKIIFEIS